MTPDGIKAAGTNSRRLFSFNGGLLRPGRVRRILALAGWTPRLGLPGPGDAVGVWGASPYAWRGEKIAARRGAQLVRIEDAFLRSVLPGRASGNIAARGPIGLLIDPIGLHFCPDAPSLIETLISSGKAQGQDHHARRAISRLIAADLSKYNAHLPQLSAPAPGYVLVIDQVRGDASLLGAGRAEFMAMLSAARDENPGARIVIRSHPETNAGLRPGHFDAADLFPGDLFCDAPLSPWALLKNAARVYVMGSLLGYEAMLAGHRPRIFGAPFYTGWGLSDDEARLPRRSPQTIETLFAASHLIAPVWYDPCLDRLTDFDGALTQLEAEARAWREDRDGHLALGFRLWKRPAINRFFGAAKGVRFTQKPQPDVTLVWASQADQAPNAARVEDGFLRSKGLGAALVPPLSLVCDDLGIYFDPRHESRLERHLNQPITPMMKDRAMDLVRQINAQRITKYNLTGSAPDLPAGHRILVPGQVEDDASIRFGAGQENTNLALLQRVRRENPQAILIYKPHPDVEAGLRKGSVPKLELARLADVVARQSSAADLLDLVDEVWTMTSTLGFEALLRKIPVTTLGAPFYAGWGLTRDLGDVPKRRQHRLDLATLAYGCLIAYPRYHDPVSDLPCPPETALARLNDPGFQTSSPSLRILAKLQGAFSSYAWIWRR